MPEKRTKIQLPGLGLVDAIEVDILESNERWTEIKLADGTTIRTKPVILSVLRVENKFDPEGNPIYQLKANQVMTANVPEELKKGSGSSSQTH